MSHSHRVLRADVVAAIDHGLWRGLAFARAQQAWSPLLGTLLRRAILVLWWTVTLQLHTHARYWLRARRLRRSTPPAPPAAVEAPVDPETLVLPQAEAPIVSVIIPSYGQIPHTLRCLASIAAHPAATPLEVIVVDDAWDGPDAAALGQVRGIRLIRNDTNLGFLRSCNKAAKQGKGRYLYFLNNDTRVLDNWLDPMLGLLREQP